MKGWIKHEVWRGGLNMKHGLNEVWIKHEGWIKHQGELIIRGELNMKGDWHHYVKSLKNLILKKALPLKG